MLWSETYLFLWWEFSLNLLNLWCCSPERLGKQVIRNRWVRTKQRWSNNLSPGKLAIESSEDGSRSFVRVLLEMEESFGENENVSFVDVFGDEFPGSG